VGVGTYDSESRPCSWANPKDPLYLAYHDEEWGVPEHDARALWEKLVLDGFQAGLSWITILRKREAFRAAFANFDPEIVARFDEADRVRLLSDAGIILLVAAEAMAPCLMGAALGTGVAAGFAHIFPRLIPPGVGVPAPAVDPAVAVHALAAAALVAGLAAAIPAGRIARTDIATALSGR